MLFDRIVNVEPASSILPEQPMERRLVHAIFMSSVGSLAFLTPDGAILRANQTCAAQFGMATDEMVGRLLSDIAREEKQGHTSLADALHTAVTIRAPISLAEVALRAGRAQRIRMTYWDCRMDPVVDDSGEVDIVVFSAINVTRRVRATKDRKAREKRFRTILDRIPAGIIIHALDGTILSTNARAREMLSPQHGRLLGKHASDADWQFYGEDGKLLPVAQYPAIQVARTGRPVRNMVLGARDEATGEFHWALVNADPIFSQSGVVVQTVVSMINITARKKAQELADRLAAIVAASDAAIIATDTEGEILTWNPGAERMLGYSAHDAVGHSISMILHPDRLAELPVIIERIRGGEHILHEETAAVRRDGRIIDVSLTISPVRDVRGEIVGASTIARDISAEKEARRIIQESEERFRSMFERNNAIMVLVDPESGDIVDANPAAAAFYGYDRETLQKMSIQSLVAPDPPVMAREREASRNAGRDYLLFPHRLASGEIRTVEMHSSTLAIGSRSLLFSILHDVTERKKAEAEQLRLNRAMRLLGSCSQLLVHSDNESRLLADVCRLIVSIGGYLAVTVWFPPDDPEGPLRSMARAGFPGDDDSPPGPLCSQSPQLHTTTVLGHCPTMQPHCQSSEILGCRACASLPLLDGQAWIGNLTIYSESPDAFNPEEVTLLEELARDFAFGIASLRVRREREAAEEQLAFLAHHDALTGLPNRIVLRENFQRALVRAERDGLHMALLFLDLDRFKSINDTMGHDIGDQLLIQAVGRLQACLRVSDTVCRQGGDEFIVLLSELADPSSVEVIARKVVDAAREPFVVNGNSISTSWSIGIAVFPRDGKDLETLRQKADMALYDAKAAGRDTFRFHCNKDSALAGAP